jgi:uncharacterized GH25 family protein
MKIRFCWFLLVLCLVFPQVVSGQTGPLQIVGDVRFPAFVKTGDLFTVSIPVKGGPIDNNVVKVIVSYDITQQMGNRHGVVTTDVKGVLKNGTVVFKYKFRGPGERRNVKCKIQYTVAGKEFETANASANTITVER